MRNDVSFEKTRAFKSKPKLFYEKFFYFVSIALGSLQNMVMSLAENFRFDKSASIAFDRSNENMG